MTIVGKPIELRDTGRIDAVAMGSTNGFLAAGLNQSNVKKRLVYLWESATGHPVGEIRTRFNGIFAVAFSSDGRHLAIGGGGSVGGVWQEPNGIEVWDIEKMEQVAFLISNQSIVYTLAFSPDGHCLAAGGYVPSDMDGNRIQLWRTNDYMEVAAFGNSTRAVHSACFSPSGDKVYFSGQAFEGQLRLTREELRALSESQLGSRLTEASRVSENTTNQKSNLIRVWGVNNRSEDEQFPLAEGLVTEISVSSDGKYLVSSGTRLILWDITTRTAARYLNEPYDGRKSNFTSCVAFLPDAKSIAVGMGDHRSFGEPFTDCGVKIIDASSGLVTSELSHRSPVHSLAVSSDGSKLVAGGESELILWHVD